jgi:transcriptional regulator with XRE-family HTH domain
VTVTWIPVPPSTDTFGQRLRVLRLGLGDISIKEAAARCGVPTATWNAWERGANSPRNMGAIVQTIVAATGVDRDWLMWGTVPADATLSGPKPP